MSSGELSKEERRALRNAQKAATAAAAAAADQEEEEEEGGGGAGAATLSAAQRAARRAVAAASSAAAAAATASAAAGEAAAAAAAAAPAQQQPIYRLPYHAAEGPLAQAGEYQFPYQVPPLPPPVYLFTDETSNRAIIAAIIANDTPIGNQQKKESLKRLSPAKLGSLLEDATPENRRAIMDLLDYGTVHEILSTPFDIQEPILEEVGKKVKGLLQASSRRRRASATGLAKVTKELFAYAAPGTRDTCFFKTVDSKTLEAMCHTFPVLNFAHLSQYTSFHSVTSQAEDILRRQTNPVAIMITSEPLTGRGAHLSAYIRAGMSWYNADNTHAVLRERTHGQPTWETVIPKSKTKVVRMIYCYADTSRIPHVTGEPRPGFFHGHPTFAQDGMGSCSVDALGSVLCFADGFRDIMSAAVKLRQNGGIHDIVEGYSQKGKHTGELDVQSCLDTVTKYISQELTASVANPRHPAEGNVLPVSTAPQGSMYFSKQVRLPSVDLVTRMIRYLAGTAIRFCFIFTEEQGLGRVPIEENASWGIQSRKPYGLKSLAGIQSRKLYGRKSLALSRRAARAARAAGPGMAVKATRKRSPENRAGLYRATAARSRSRARQNRHKQKIRDKRRPRPSPPMDME